MYVCMCVFMHAHACVYVIHAGFLCVCVCVCVWNIIFFVLYGYELYIYCVEWFVFWASLLKSSNHT